MQNDDVFEFLNVENGAEGYDGSYGQSMFEAEPCLPDLLGVLQPQDIDLVGKTQEPGQDAVPNPEFCGQAFQNASAYPESYNNTSEQYNSIASTEAMNAEVGRDGGVAPDDGTVEELLQSMFGDNLQELLGNQDGANDSGIGMLDDIIEDLERTANAEIEKENKASLANAQDGGRDLVESEPSKLTNSQMKPPSNRFEGNVRFKAKPAYERCIEQEDSGEVPKAFQIHVSGRRQNLREFVSFDPTIRNTDLNTGTNENQHSAAFYPSLPPTNPNLSAMQFEQVQRNQLPQNLPKTNLPHLNQIQQTQLSQQNQLPQQSFSQQSHPIHQAMLSQQTQQLQQSKLSQQSKMLQQQAKLSQHSQSAQQAQLPLKSQLPPSKHDNYEQQFQLPQQQTPHFQQLGNPQRFLQQQGQEAQSHQPVNTASFSKGTKPKYSGSSISSTLRNATKDPYTKKMLSKKLKELKSKVSRTGYMKILPKGLNGQTSLLRKNYTALSHASYITGAPNLWISRDSKHLPVTPATPANSTKSSTLPHPAGNSNLAQKSSMMSQQQMNFQQPTSKPQPAQGNEEGSSCKSPLPPQPMAAMINRHPQATPFMPQPSAGGYLKSYQDYISGQGKQILNSATYSNRKPSQYYNPINTEPVLNQAFNQQEMERNGYEFSRNQSTLNKTPWCNKKFYPEGKVCNLMPGAPKHICNISCQRPLNFTREVIKYPASHFINIFKYKRNQAQNAEKSKPKSPQKTLSQRQEVPKVKEKHHTQRNIKLPEVRDELSSETEDDPDIVCLDEEAVINVEEDVVADSYTADSTTAPVDSADSTTGNATTADSTTEDASAKDDEHKTDDTEIDRDEIEDLLDSVKALRRGLSKEEKERREEIDRENFSNMFKIKKRASDQTNSGLDSDEELPDV